MACRNCVLVWINVKPDPISCHGSCFNPPPPSRMARRHLLELHIADTPAHLSESDWDLLVSRTEGYSGSDIATCVADALLEPVRELEGAQFWRGGGGHRFTPCAASEPGAVRHTLADFLPHQVVTIATHHACAIHWVCI